MNTTWKRFRYICHIRSHLAGQLRKLISVGFTAMQGKPDIADLTPSKSQLLSGNLLGNHTILTITRLIMLRY